MPAVQYSVVVPVYNAEATLAALVGRLEAVFADLGASYEIVLVDDGSRDHSWQVILDLRREGRPVRALRLGRNHGQHLALKAGLDHCAGRRAVTMDCDLQHPPEEIPKLIAALEAQPELDAVIARYARKRHSLLRNAASRLHTWVQRRVFRTPRGLALTSFRLINADVLRALREMHLARPRLGPMLMTLTDRLANVEVRHNPPPGRSTYSWARLSRDALDATLCYSALPLRAVGAVGAAGVIAALALALAWLVTAVAGSGLRVEVALPTLLMLLLGGVALLGLWLVGEQLERVLAQQLMASPYQLSANLPPPGERGGITRGEDD